MLQKFKQSKKIYNLYKITIINNRAFSIFEFIIFTILFFPILLLLLSSLETFTDLFTVLNNHKTTTNLAKNRLELILAYNNNNIININNTNSIIDPCTLDLYNSNNLCIIPDGFNITSNITPDNINPNNFSIININSTGPNGSNITINYKIKT